MCRLLFAGLAVVVLSSPAIAAPNHVTTGSNGFAGTLTSPTVNLFKTKNLADKKKPSTLQHPSCIPTGIIPAHPCR
jgi:hypothetical protein